MEGWIKLHRKVIENELWHSERFTRAQAWIDLILRANHKARTVFIKGVEFNLQPGELCYSQVSLAEKWQWNPRTVNKFLKLLESREMIRSKTSQITTVITVLRWNEYQHPAEQNAVRSRSGLQTDKNVKNREDGDSQIQGLTETQRLLMEVN